MDPSPMQGFAPVQGQNGGSPMPPFSPVLLLSFLALTARFHPQLVAHHSPASSSRPSNPIIASEYYAAAAKSRLSGNLGDGLGTPDLDRVQALLMLVLHDWGNCQGQKAWVSLGVAIRYAQILGFQYERDLDDEPYALSQALQSEADRMGVKSHRDIARPSLSSSEEFIRQEIRRRTFWSCFVLDRYISSGKYRPQMLNVHDLRIQLPSTDRAFLFGEKVRTLLLGEEQGDTDARAEAQNKRLSSTTLGNGDVQPSPSSDRHSHDDLRGGRWEVSTDEGVLSRYIKVIDLYGKLVKWSCSGGRR